MNISGGSSENTGMGRRLKGSDSDDFDSDDAFQRADAFVKKGIMFPRNAAVWLAQQPLSVAFGHGNLVGPAEAADWLLQLTKDQLPTDVASWLVHEQGYSIVEAAEWALTNDSEHSTVADWMVSHGATVSSVAEWAETSDWALQDVGSWLCLQGWSATQAAHWIAQAEDGGQEDVIFLRVCQRWPRRKVTQRAHTLHV